MNAEYVGRGQEAFLFQFVVWAVLTSHDWVGFDCKDTEHIGRDAT